MAEESKTIILPDNQNSGFGSLPVALALNPGWNNNYPPYAYGNNGLFGGSGSGFGAGILGGLLGGLIWGGIGGNGFGWGNNNWGGNGAAFLGNQMNNDNNTDLLMTAITSQGEQARSATQNLATTLGQDFDLVNGAVMSIRDGIGRLEASTGMSALQIVNAIQAGDASLSRQLCECCCENRLLTTEQGYQAQIRTIEQTNQLGSQADRNTASVVGAINALHTDMTREFCEVREREQQATINRQAETITQLRGQIDNANQTAAITGYINSVISPLQRDVDKIRENQPNTVPVQWPQLQAVNTTPYVSGGYYGMQPGFGWGGGYFGGFGNGFGGNIVF